MADNRLIAFALAAVVGTAVIVIWGSSESARSGPSVLEPALEARTDQNGHLVTVEAIFHRAGAEPNLWSPGVRIKAISIAGRPARWSKNGDWIRASVPADAIDAAALGERYDVDLVTNDGNGSVRFHEVLRAAPVTLCSPDHPC